jgi:hypothetical protein
MRFVLLALIVGAAIVLGVRLSAVSGDQASSRQPRSSDDLQLGERGLHGVWWPSLQWRLHGIWPLCTTGQVVIEYDAQFKHRGRAEEISFKHLALALIGTAPQRVESCGLIGVEVF